MTRRFRRYDLGLRRGNVAGLIAMCILGAIGLVARGTGARQWSAPNGTIDRNRIAAAAEKINPNTASVASLRRLPMIGPAKAQKIVEFQLSGGVFRQPADLRRVNGIGPKIVLRISPYLQFDSVRH